MRQSGDDRPIAAASGIQPLRDAGDSSRAETGFLFNRGIWDLFGEHLRRLQPFSEFSDLFFRHQIAQKPLSLVCCSQGEYRFDKSPVFLVFPVHGVTLS